MIFKFYEQKYLEKIEFGTVHQTGKISKSKLLVNFK